MIRTQLELILWLNSLRLSTKKKPPFNRPSQRPSVANVDLLDPGRATTGVLARIPCVIGQEKIELDPRTLHDSTKFLVHVL